MAPETFLRVLGPDPYRVAYVQPSRRPADGRYGENPNRLYKHQQLQVILKPSPDDVIDLYLKSLEAIGIDLRKHDIKFEEDNWESPTLGAWGVGWQVMLDGLEITQFTYFQQCGGVDLDLVPAELTYGLERLTAFLQVRDSVYDIEWAPNVSYAQVRFADELQYSVYNFEMADVDTLWKLFDLHEKEAQRLLDLYPKSKEKAALPAAGRLRSRAQVLAPVQHARFARRDQRDRARRRNRPRAKIGSGRRASLGRTAAGRKSRMSLPFLLENRHRRNPRLDDPGRARKSALPLRRDADKIRPVRPIHPRRRHCPTSHPLRHRPARTPIRFRRTSQRPSQSRPGRRRRRLREEARHRRRIARRAIHSEGRVLLLHQKSLQASRSSRSWPMPCPTSSSKSISQRPCTGPARPARASSAPFAGSWRCSAMKSFRSS